MEHWFTQWNIQYRGLEHSEQWNNNGTFRNGASSESVIVIRLLQ